MQPAQGQEPCAWTNTWYLGHGYFLSSHWLFSPSPLKLQAVLSGQGTVRLWPESLYQLCHTYIIHPLLCMWPWCSSINCHQAWLVGLQPSQTFTTSLKYTWPKLPFLRASSTDKTRSAVLLFVSFISRVSIAGKNIQAFEFINPSSGLQQE